MRHSSLIAVLLLASALTGCAMSGTTYTQAKQRAAAPAPGTARVYMYRESSMFGAGVQPSVFLDGVKVRNSVPGSFTAKDVAPGAHRITVETETEKTYDFTAKAQDEIYVREAPGFGYLIGRVHLEPVSAQEAAKEIADLHEMNIAPPAKK